MDLNYYEALSIEEPAETGADEIDSANEDEDARSGEAPDSEEEIETHREEESGGGEQPDSDKPQTKEERAKNAAARRKAELNAAVEKAKQELKQELKQEAERERAEAKIREELRQIHAMDPDISTVEDLLNMESSKEFYNYVQKGNSFIDAFYLANRDKIAGRAREAAKQQALTHAASKEHLSSHGRQRGQGSVLVPAEELTYYRQFMPGASDAEIQKHYNKYIQSRK